MKLVKKISTHGNRSPQEITWTTIVRIDEKSGLIDVNFYRPTPFCKDGYKDGIVELLTNMKWEASTMMGITGKSGLSPAGFVNAFSFIEAYKNVYERIVKHPHDDIPLTLQEFLDLVKIEEKKTNYGAILNIALNNILRRTASHDCSISQFSDWVKREEARITESPEEIVSTENVKKMLTEKCFELVVEEQDQNKEEEKTLPSETEEDDGKRTKEFSFECPCCGIQFKIRIHEKGFETEQDIERVLGFSAAKATHKQGDCYEELSPNIEIIKKQKKESLWNR